VTVQVLLAGDQAMVRSGFRLILESQPGITVAAEAADGIQAVALARELRPDVCIEAVRAASAGDALISPSVTVRLLKQLAPARSPAAGAGNQLSGRELDIARSIARGRTNQEIAAELFISLSTVKTHIARIQNKLGVRNRVGIATWSWENRIMDQ
jgi:DNA-binding NarL/FixJ family response regulator